YSFVPNGSALVSEDLVFNNLIDHTETVSVDFTLQNAGVTTSSNLTATLRSTGGVTLPDAPKNYGALAPGASATRTFEFTANGTPGSNITATFDLTDSGFNLGTVTYVFALARLPAALLTSLVVTAES